jgi:hypothetical protein
MYFGPTTLFSFFKLLKTFGKGEPEKERDSFNKKIPVAIL